MSASIQTSKRGAVTFFKTGAGEYAEKDEFIGVPVPVIRKIAQQFAHISMENIELLLHSKINEERLLALIILTQRYTKAADTLTKETVYQFYLKNIEYVNNWNLVDSSAHLIIGAHLFDKPRDILYILAQSESLWNRRIAIVTTWYFIRKGDVTWTFKIATLLRNDTHNLIHKAVGWILREAGEKDRAQLLQFLDHYANILPRTMLRYAIEKLPKNQRAYYMLL